MQHSTLRPRQVSLGYSTTYQILHWITLSSIGGLLKKGAFAITQARSTPATPGAAKLWISLNLHTKPLAIQGIRGTPAIARCHANSYLLLAMHSGQARCQQQNFAAVDTQPANQKTLSPSGAFIGLIIPFPCISLCISILLWVCSTPGFNCFYCHLLVFYSVSYSPVCLMAVRGQHQLVQGFNFRGKSFPPTRFS